MLNQEKQIAPHAPTTPEPKPSQLPSSDACLPSPVTTSSRYEPSLFRFKSKVGEWLALAALIIGIVSLAFTARAYILSTDIAVWEAEKDYKAYCEDLQANDKEIPAKCDTALNGLLPPPPHHADSFYEADVQGIQKQGDAVTMYTSHDADSFYEAVVEGIQKRCEAVIMYVGGIHKQSKANALWKEFAEQDVDVVTGVPRRDEL